GFFQDLALQGFSSRKFGFDFFRISQALGNTLAALGQHGQNRSVSKTVEEESDDAKTDDLSDKMGLVQAKFIRSGFGRLSQIAADACEKHKLIHKLSITGGAEPIRPRAWKRFYLTRN